MKNATLILRPQALALALALCFCAAGALQAQVVGVTTTVDVSVTEMSQLTYGYSAKKDWLGKVVFNELGASLGEVEDLIFSPDQSLSHLILSTGGFLGMGGRAVAIPIAQIKEDRSADTRLIWTGADAERIRAMPQFEYLSELMRRDQYIAQAEREIAQLKTKIGTEPAKAALAKQYALMQQDLQTAETGLSNLKRSGSAQWHGFQEAVSKAITRIKKSLDQ
jgi:PRC-barrel domain